MDAVQKMNSHKMAEQIDKSRSLDWAVIDYSPLTRRRFEELVEVVLMVEEEFAEEKRLKEGYKFLVSGAVHPLPQVDKISNTYAYKPQPLEMGYTESHSRRDIPDSTR